MRTPNFCIYRNVDSDTLRLFHGIQKTIKSAAEGFVRIDRPRLKLVGSRFIIKAAMGLDAEGLNKAIFPLPESAAHELTLGVKGLKSVYGHHEKPYLVVALEDTEAVFQDERTRVDARMRRGLGLRALPPDVFAPHLALGKVFPEALNPELVEQVESNLPSAITFMPVTYPLYTPDSSDEQRVAVSAAPHRIPQGFLDSLRGETQ